MGSLQEEYGLGLARRPQSVVVSARHPPRVVWRSHLQHYSPARFRLQGIYFLYLEKQHIPTR
jgi:hypothetical protein